jgi:RNA polymerase sigma factor (TIGR02999 family)
MTDVTQILNAIEQGDSSAAGQLLPLLYDELRQLAAQKLAQEKPGQTLQPTALVHEAYLRLVDQQKPQRWDSRGHFFAAAAEAMRRILVDQARRKLSLRRGGDLQRHPIEEREIEAPGPSVDVLAVHEALERFQGVDATAARVIKPRYLAGLTIPQAPEPLGRAASTRRSDPVLPRSSNCRPPLPTPAQRKEPSSSQCGLSWLRFSQAGSRSMRRAVVLPVAGAPRSRAGSCWARLHGQRQAALPVHLGGRWVPGALTCPPA